MLFSSPFFIFIFLPLFFSGYYFTPVKYRGHVLLTASLGFYFWGEPAFCLLAIASALLDYWLCQTIYVLGEEDKTLKQAYLTLGITANILILFYFKYTNFFLSAISQLIPRGKYHFEFFDIILPIGVSFIVFEKITYLVDVYRGIGKPAKTILDYLNYVFLFPKLLAGPIIKYHEIESQLTIRDVTNDNIANGFKRFLLGLAKKVFIADVCGSVANQVFALDANDLSFNYAWLGIICFTLQIYFDFSGYSDMALGLARMLGFELRENFNVPYISTSFTEFWRRWHISLSTWIREYLYIPLGGSYVSQVRVYINLWICFLLSGLWHGANWTFMLWGAYNGLFLVLDKIIWLKVSNRLPKIISMIITLFLVIFGWVIFRSNNTQQIKYYFIALMHPSSQSDHFSSYIDMTSDIFATIAIGFLLALAPISPIYVRSVAIYRNLSWRIYIESALYGMLGFLAICKMVGASYTPFLYFKF
jgi:alginate O-acetyltransferase complex protein AlgI